MPDPYCIRETDNRALRGEYVRQLEAEIQALREECKRLRAQAYEAERDGYERYR